jgi:hypothetical protein
LVERSPCKPAERPTYDDTPRSPPPSKGSTDKSPLTDLSTSTKAPGLNSLDFDVQNFNASQQIFAEVTSQGKDHTFNVIKEESNLDSDLSASSICQENFQKESNFEITSKFTNQEDALCQLKKGTKNFKITRKFVAKETFTAAVQRLQNAP